MQMCVFSKLSAVDELEGFKTLAFLQTLDALITDLRAPFVAVPNDIDFFYCFVCCTSDGLLETMCHNS